jgi:hypothetical protein
MPLIVDFISGTVFERILFDSLRPTPPNLKAKALGRQTEESYPYSAICFLSKETMDKLNSIKLQWGRIIAGAVLLELALIIVFVPLLASFDPKIVVPFVVVGCFVFGVAAGWWTVRKVRGRHVLHATLVGLVATIIYLLLCMSAPGGLAAAAAVYGTLLFILANGLRILGCIVGGFAFRA